MEVNLLTTPEHFAEMEHNAAYAMLTCHANTDRLQSEKPAKFLKHVIKVGHESVLEHITITYEINNISRACLQELARHRHISLSVESTRHTLKRILDENIEDGGAVDEAFLEQFDANLINKNLYMKFFLCMKQFLQCQMTN